jgi:hypothetical protein
MVVSALSAAQNVICVGGALRIEWENVVYFLEPEKREQSKFKISDVEFRAGISNPLSPDKTTESFRIRKWYAFSIEYLSESRRD